MTERIVVGVDGSRGAAAALEWACREAARRGARLQVVTASVPTGLAPPVDEITAMEPWFRAAREEAADVLDRSLEQLGDRAAGVTVERLVVDDTPARGLLRHAEGADMLVVGTRGRGGFTGLLLGSVSQHCAQHARCPVVVVPSPARAAGR